MTQISSKPNIEAAHVNLDNARYFLNKAVETEGNWNDPEVLREVSLNSLAALDFLIKALSELVDPCEMLKTILASTHGKLLEKLPYCLTEIYETSKDNEQFGYADIIAEEMVDYAIEALKTISAKEDIEKAKQLLKAVIERATNALIEVGGTVQEAHEAVEDVKLKTAKTNGFG